MALDAAKEANELYQGERPGSCSDEENQSKNGSGASQLGSAKGKAEDRL
jgi:hypothetical protein